MGKKHAFSVAVKSQREMVLIQGNNYLNAIPVVVNF
jgi:hypothetical protein